MAAAGRPGRVNRSGCGESDRWARGHPARVCPGLGLQGGG